MKAQKVLAAVCLSFAIVACTSDNESLDNQKDANLVQATSGTTVLRNCAADDVLEEQLKENPSLGLKMQEIENFTQRQINSNFASRLVNGVIEIPVVVNVLYSNSAENISAAQIQSQIDVLNQDYNAQNSDFSMVPSIFSGVKANVGVRFVLDNVVRKSTTKTSWGTRDTMKNSKRGGLSPTSPTTKLNLWVCTIGGGILGYAQFPGGSSATDGVVIDSKYFGLSGTTNYPYNLGRTATHEIGHWMNLRHIWGDTTCGTDYVADTPSHNAANYGVPSYPHYSTCSGTPVEMTMDYMDYTDDRGMFMFSNDQKSRMLAIFQPGGARYAFAQ